MYPQWFIEPISKLLLLFSWLEDALEWKLFEWPKLFYCAGELVFVCFFLTFLAQFAFSLVFYWVQIRLWLHILLTFKDFNKFKHSSLTFYFTNFKNKNHLHFNHSSNFIQIISKILFQTLKIKPYLFKLLIKFQTK